MDPGSSLSRAGRLLDRIEMFVVVGCCAGIVVLVFSGVLSRFFFHYSIAWSEELARFLFVWGALFGAAAAFRTGGHGGISIFVNKLPEGMQRVVEMLAFLLVSVLLVYLAWQSYATVVRTWESGQTSTTTNMPIWVLNGGMLAAFLLAVLRNLQGYLRGTYRPDKVANDG